MSEEEKLKKILFKINKNKQTIRLRYENFKN